MQANKLFDLGGKVALVTGGSRGIGFQMAEALGEMGCKLAISARKQHELGAASAALRRTNIEVLTIAKDLGAATADADGLGAVVGLLPGPIALKLEPHPAWNLLGASTDGHVQRRRIASAPAPKPVLKGNPRQIQDIGAKRTLRSSISPQA
jgi:NAD(P)-dependent dehydrogenase (short-subunit alcohol dehydrogenase family)